MTTPGCKKHTRPLLFLWRFDQDGNPYMDSRIDVDNYPEPSKAVHDAFGMELRMRFNGGTRMALFHIPKDMPVSDVEKYIETASNPELRKNILEKLHGAEISLRDITGKGSDSNAVNFIHSLCEDGCSCGREEEE